MRFIVHLDADAFFASVEQAADPRLRGRPVAVGGEKRGIIASASYEARKFGIYTPMPTVRARRLCPKLILLPGDFEKYEHFSQWMFSYAYDFTPDVEITSIDEGYFDLSGARRSPEDIARTIRRAIGQSLKISVSEGIASNKLVSQIASKLHKPAAFSRVPAGMEPSFLNPLPNRWLPGVGPQAASRLNAAGLLHIGQIARTPPELLHMLLGRWALSLQAFARGMDERPVVPARAPAKSYGHQETFREDQTDESFVEATLRRMADHLMAKVRADRKSIRTLTVKVRYNDMDEDQRSESLCEPTDLETDLYPRLQPLLRQAWQRRVSLRLVALRVSNVYESFQPTELPLLPVAQQREAQRRLAAVVDTLRHQRGRHIVFRGHDLALRQAKPPSGPKGGNPPVSPSRHISPPRRRVSGEPSRCGTLPVSALPLCVHSHYSFLNSTLSPEAIVQLAQQQGMPAVALTDDGNLHGAVAFTLKAKAAGIRPILGASIRVGGRTVRLYVQNAEGYHHLCRILSWNGETGGSSLSAGANASDPEPRPGDSLPSSALASTEGLIALATDPALATRFPGRFYLAVTSPRTFRNQPAARDLPAVAALPVRYASPSGRRWFDILQAIRTQTLLRQPHPDKLVRGAFHFRGASEWAERFRDHPELLRRTHEIAGRCTFELPIGPPQFPAYRPPGGGSSRAFLRQRVFAGLRRRYGHLKEGMERFHRQVREELAIIHEVGYEEYFLVVWELLQECRRRGIEWITRGSAADSLVCYCLGISDVCPVRFGLYFRRFLNKERMSMHKLPDIDVDFPHDRKDEVIDLVFEKYGAGHAAVVGGFSTFQTRSAVADIAKVLGVSEHQIRRFTEHMPWTYPRPREEEADPAADPARARPERSFLYRALRASPECGELPIDEEPYRTAILMAEFLHGVPRYPKMHPCGVVLSRQPMHHLTPTFTSRKGYPTTHFDMDAVEAVGLVKIDILAQGGLAAMRDVRRLLETSPGSTAATRAQARAYATAHSAFRTPPVPLRYDDPAVWAMIASGNARAVHHIESPAMVSLCRMCNVRDIDGLIAIVSVIRPGAANEQKKTQFTRRYQKLEPVTYPHPVLEPILRSTFGLVVYEEHILQICEAFAGLSLGRADTLRRSLVKMDERLIDQIGREFVEGARARGHAEATIREVWDKVRGFAGYAFCKAHSTAYGVEAYQSAWLKKYFPAPFMAAVLTNGKGFYHPIVYVLECHRLGIPLLPPNVNAPGPHFGVEPFPGRRPPGAAGQRPGPLPAIRVPATRVKGLTETTRQRMVTEQRRAPFGSLRDFYQRVHPSAEEMETLLRAGAFDLFGQARTHLFWEIQQLRHLYSHGNPAGQGWLLPPSLKPRLPKSGPPDPSLPDLGHLSEPTRLQRLQWEMDLLGFPASGHPLELHEDIDWKSYCPVARLGAQVGQTVVTCGLVIEQRLHHQATGEPMKFLTLADWSGMVETELFASTYRSYGLATVRYPVLEVTATVEPFENGRGFTLRVLRAGKPRRKRR